MTHEDATNHQRDQAERAENYTETTHVIALSGGKDSTAMALHLADVEPRDYTYLITPTGDELPEMEAHWDKLERLLGKPLTRITNGTLDSWITHFNALPNWRQRWCTRLLKIEPAILFYKTHSPCIAYVGLRADEPINERVGIYGEDTPQRFPLREWGWGIEKVRAYLRHRDVIVPLRTDCAKCYGQRLGEWRNLRKNYPERWEDAKAQEEATGATFRSPGRDSKPAGLVQLQTVFEAEEELLSRQTVLFEMGPAPINERAPCRVCSL